MPALRIKRGTRAQLTTAMAASQLAVGEPYLVTDERVLAVGTAANAYALAGKPTIDQIAGLAPTLYLDFKEQDYRHYSPSTGLRKKDLSDIVTFTRASEATYFDAKGMLQTAGSNVPRLDFDPATGACKGLLIEESRTNLLTYSDQINDAAWSKIRLTVTENAVTSPAGEVTADLVIPTATSGDHYLSRTVATNYATNTAIAASAFFKAGGYEIVSIHIIDTVNSWRESARFNVRLGTIVSQTAGANATITPCGFGFHRCAVNAICTGNVTVCNYFYDSGGASVFAGDGTSGIYIWGAQLEQGAFPTSYIPTTDSMAQRFADVAVISGAVFVGMYPASAMSALVCTSRIGMTTEQARALSLNDGTASNAIEIAVTGAIKPIGYVTTNGVSQSAIVGSADGQMLAPRTFALGVVANDVALVSDGVIDVVDTSASLPTMLTQVNLGNTAASNRTLCGHLRRVALWPSRLPNATLQQLTA